MQETGITECHGPSISAAGPGAAISRRKNVTYKNYINTTWVAREIKGFKVPTDEEIFGDVMKDTELSRD